MSYIRRLLADDRGAGAAEFSMVLPLLLLLIFGIIDSGRFLWEVNRAEKATQMGARYAVVTDPVDNGLEGEDFVGIAGLKVAETIPQNAMPTISCDGATSACSNAFGAWDDDAFSAILNRMRAIKPDIAAANVVVSYSASGLGYAGDPTGMDVVPLVTVELKDVEFRPITALLFATMTLPSFSTSLTGEDHVGSQSN